MSNLFKFPADLPTPLIDAPFFAELLEGNPQTKTWRLWTNGELTAGIWEASSGLWRIDYKIWEYCHLLEGAAVITPEGETPRSFISGDTFVCEIGLKGTWRVTETVRKHFVVHRAASTNT
jgi:hypothetical protein